MKSPPRTPVRLRRRATLPVLAASLLQLAMVVTGYSVMFGGDTSVFSLNEGLFTWDVLALLLLVGTFTFASKQAKQVAPQPWARTTFGDEPPRWLGRLMGWGADLIPVIASLMGMFGALAVLFQGETDAELSLVMEIMGAFTILCAWLTMHVSYAQRYAWLYYREGGGLEFPRTATPVMVDFLYFALTLGSSFATSDVEIVSRRMRWHVLSHSIVSFFYNAVVLAVAISLITKA